MLYVPFENISLRCGRYYCRWVIGLIPGRRNIKYLELLFHRAYSSRITSSHDFKQVLYQNQLVTKSHRRVAKQQNKSASEDVTSLTVHEESYVSKKKNIVRQKTYNWEINKPFFHFIKRIWYNWCKNLRGKIFLENELGVWVNN